MALVATLLLPYETKGRPMQVSITRTLLNHETPKQQNETPKQNTETPKRNIETPKQRNTETVKHRNIENTETPKRNTQTSFFFSFSFPSWS